MAVLGFFMRMNTAKWLDCINIRKTCSQIFQNDNRTRAGRLDKYMEYRFYKGDWLIYLSMYKSAHNDGANRSSQKKK